ncbi:MAG: lipopolysaccharide biosynthesis protein RfbH, partial [Myxococcales bacterium]|nr:lipopolysaccharide biosynthesis protein RfbH [Myxococcales bacterium]
MEARALRAQILELVRQYSALHHTERPFDPENPRVRYAGRVYDDAELVNLVDASLDFWLTAGHYSDEFENGFAEFFGVSDSILVNSGSSANLVAVTALTSPLLGERRLLPGDEVLTVAAGFPTTVNPIIQNRLVPVFVDVELGTYAPTAEAIREAIGPRTRAIFIAHTLANPFELDTVRELCDEHHLWLLEDNCDAVGSTFDGRLTGTFGSMATVSFYPAHHMTMGEGGAVVTNDPLLARICRSVRDWGRDCYCAAGEDNTCGKRFSQQFGDLPYGYDHKYVYSHIGYNLKVTDMQAAIGCAQLEKLPRFIRARKENFKVLYDGLTPFSDTLILPRWHEKADPAWFGFPITLREGARFGREEL